MVVSARRFPAQRRARNAMPHLGGCEGAQSMDAGKNRRGVSAHAFGKSRAGLFNRASFRLSVLNPRRELNGNAARIRWVNNDVGWLINPSGAHG